MIMFSHTFLGACVTKWSHPGALQLTEVVFPPALDAESPISRAVLILKCMYNDENKKNKKQKTSKDVVAFV